MRPLPHLIFMSRWLQLPLYLGLILAQAVYVWHFWVELVHLVEAAFGNQEALSQIVAAIIGISSIHLLKTFINAQAYDEKTLLWQTVIHITFLLSATAIAATDRIMPQGRGTKATSAAH